MKHLRSKERERDKTTDIEDQKKRTGKRQKYWDSEGQQEGKEIKKNMTKKVKKLEIKLIILKALSNFWI